MAKHILKIILIPVVLCCAALLFLYCSGDLGIPKSWIERDARSSQKITEDWRTELDCSDTMAALISYPEDGSDHTFSVYVNRPGLSFGYFFRGGGDIVETEQYITKFTVEGYDECAYLSMNAQQVERVEIDDGTSVKTMELDSGKPFALVLPLNAGAITFYDKQGDVVETCTVPL